MRHLRIPRLLVVLLALPVLANTVAADDWPQWLGPQRDGVWRETGIVEKFPGGGPKVRWRHDIGGGYAGPAVAEGKVYVTDRLLAQGEKDNPNPFAQAKSAGQERVLCLNEKDGQVLWTHSYPCKYGISYPCGPRTTPIVKDGKVYTLGAMGDLFCLDADKGTVIWSKNFMRDYKAPPQAWGFSASPLLDGNKLICIVGGESGVAVAFDKNDGKELWKTPSMKNIPAGYCPPMIFQVGKTRQLIIWHPEAVNGLNPETGEVYWTVKSLVRSGLTIPTPRLAGDKLFVTSFYSGPLMLKLDLEKPGAKVLWKGMGRGEFPGQTDGLHAIMCTPFIKDGYIYGVCSYGRSRAVLKADTGERVWEDLRATGTEKEPVERWANAFIVPHEDRYFLFNEKGDLIMAKLTPQGYDEISRTHLLDPTGPLSAYKGSEVRKIVWTHPAFANKSVYARNDKEIVCVSLAKE